MAGLELRNVSKVYPGGVSAVEGANLTISDGEFIVLVGPSGCGKSTILRMVAGLERITKGEILIGGECVNDLEPGARDIAMVFQNYALYPHMSVYDNMAYGLRNQGMKRDGIATRVRQAADILQLGALLKRRPRELSGGQRQRVAMGRAIVREPKVFLFDEPLSNLDAKLRTSMRSEIKALHKRLGATFIYVTHDQTEAMSLADRIVVMGTGVIEQIGTPREVYDKPASRFVAEFIGSPPMNFLPGIVLGLDAPWIGVRPEALSIAGSRAQDAATFSLSGAISHVEDLGADSYVHVRLNGAAAQHEITVKTSGAVPGSAGSDVDLSVRRNALHPFDEDGRALISISAMP